MAAADDDRAPAKKSRGRKRERKSKTISVRSLTREVLVIGRILYPETKGWRPRTRGNCKRVERPCPFVSCKYHLYLDVNPVNGAIKLNFPDLEVWELEETCALDVADRGGIFLEQVGDLMNLTRERVRQVEKAALSKCGETKLKEFK